MNVLRTSRRLVLMVGCLTLLFAFFSMAQGAVSVGDAPSLKFKAATGENVDLSVLKGEIVLVDFWATWCGPCMAEAGHMVEINKTYKEKGLVIIGISLDQDKAKMLRVAKGKGFTWPQYFDGLGWKNKIAQVWGVDRIPCTFLIGKDGKVIWTGHPAQIDPELKKAFKE